MMGKDAKNTHRMMAVLLSIYIGFKNLFLMNKYQHNPLLF